MPWIRSTCVKSVFMSNAHTKCMRTPASMAGLCARVRVRLFNLCVFLFKITGTFLYVSEKRDAAERRLKMLERRKQAMASSRPSSLVSAQR